VEGPLTSKLGPKQIQIVSDRLEEFKSYIPSNFSRKCRGLNELAHFKATEFRTFVLYVGPFALRKILNKDKFDHFLCLHVAIYILVSEAQNEEWVTFAGELIEKFVSEIPKLYHKELIVYNFHSILHLHDEARIYGCLDNFSAFEFESYMQKIKRLLRSHSSHLSQVVRRIEETVNSNYDDPAAISKYIRGKGFSSSGRDNCYRTTDKKYCIIKSISPFVVQYLEVIDISWYPIKSSKLGIYKVIKYGDIVEVLPQILCRKCIFLRTPNEVTGYVVPLCNSDLTSN